MTSFVVGHNIRGFSQRPLSSSLFIGPAALSPMASTFDPQHQIAEGKERLFEAINLPLYSDLTMKFTLCVVSVFLLLVAIGAPPVVEKATKDKSDNGSKTDESDEVVRQAGRPWRATLIVLVLAKQP